MVVYLEKHSDADEEAPLPEGPNITSAWVESFPDGQGLAQAISGGDWEGWYAWVTGEVTATRHAKTVLQRDAHLNRGTLHAQGYWVAGRAMGKSRVLQQAAETAAPAAVNAADTADTADTAAAPASDPTPPKKSSAGVLAPAKVPMIIAGVFQTLLSVLGIVPFILFAELCRQLLDGADRDTVLGTGVAAGGHGGLRAGHHTADAGDAPLRRQLLRRTTPTADGQARPTSPGVVHRQTEL